MYSLKLYQATASGRVNTATPKTPSAWLAIASAAPCADRLRLAARRGISRPLRSAMALPRCPSTSPAPALMTIFKGVTTDQQMGEALPTMSLVRQHLIGGHTPPMLLIAGAKDTQVPPSDTYLLLSSGQDPKDAWINPLGGHMGRDTSAWPDAKIYQKVVVPWLLRHLGISPDQGGH